MASYFNDIRSALENHLYVLANSESLMVAWDGQSYSVSDGEYLRPTFLPGETVQQSLGSSGMDSISGVFQIDVITPKGSPRSRTPDEIADHFRRGLTLTEGRTRVRLRTTSISTTTHDEAWSITPVSVSCDTYLEPR